MVADKTDKANATRTWKSILDSGEAVTKASILRETNEELSVSREDLGCGLWPEIGPSYTYRRSRNAYLFTTGSNCLKRHIEEASFPLSTAILAHPMIKKSFACYDRSHSERFA